MRVLSPPPPFFLGGGGEGGLSGNLHTQKAVGWEYLIPNLTTNIARLFCYANVVMSKWQIRIANNQNSSMLM